MMGVKGKLLKKLKSVKTIGYLKPDRILQLSTSDFHFYPPPLPKKQEPPKPDPVQQPEIIDVSELMKDLRDQDTDLEDDEMDGDKENLRPKENFRNNSQSTPPDSKCHAKDEGLQRKEFRVVDDRHHFPLSEIDSSPSSYRRPDLNSGTLFDPNLLAAFQQAIAEVNAREAAERRSRIAAVVDEPEPPLKTRKVEQVIDPLMEFEERCPPGGSDSIVVYTTGLHAIRKTFEDCQKMRSLLENLRVLFFERDISMHSGYSEELWEILGGKIVPPRLFIKGRYIGGVDEVLGLHEQGKLKPLIQGIPADLGEGPCEGCIGFRFIVCFNCNGSQKIVPEGDGGEPVNCSECNENGMIICPFCC